MAAGLNPPSKTTQGKGSNINMELLPPSAFETKRSSDPWKELARTTGELIHLRLENQQLRQEQAQPKPAISFNEEIRARVDVHKSAADADTTRHLDELIQRQAAEITQLKQEMRTLQADHKQEVTELEKEIALKDRQHFQSISAMEAELKSRADNYEYQVDLLSSAYQREVEELTETTDKLKARLNSTQSVTGERVLALEARLQQLTDTSGETITRLDQILQTKEEAISQLKKQVTSLKTYIGESEKGPLPAKLWKKEKTALEKKQMELASEKDSLRSTVELLSIRLSAVNDILTLQEKELSKAKVETMEKSKLESLLLTRWREKVYALLVQQKSADIVSKKDFQNWKEKLKNREEELDSCKTQTEVLTCSLSERDAVIEMERKQNETLRNDLTNAQQIAIALDDQLRETMQQVDYLKHALLSEFFTEKAEANQTAMEMLKTYGQRITFATGRLEVLQAQFTRKEAHLRLQIEQSKKTEAERDEPQDHTEHRMSPVSHLQEELEAVTRERDTLAAQIREDSLLMEERLAACRKEVEAEVNSLRSTVIALETSLQERSEKCVSLSEKLEVLEREFGESRECIESLNTELGKQQLSAQQDLKNQQTEIEAEFAEKLTDMERKVNEAKREQAKAVVSLRQTERQAGRDKERHEEISKVREEHFSRQMDTLQQQLKAVEKERNIMMTTLRQEGLMGRVKLQREEPVLLEEPKPEVTSGVKPPGDHQLQLSSGKGLSEEPIGAVLEDLQSLAAAVMGDEDDSDESEDPS